jgi:hypothetical protein
MNSTFVTTKGEKAFELTESENICFLGHKASQCSFWSYSLVLLGVHAWCLQICKTIIIFIGCPTKVTQVNLGNVKKQFDIRR